MRNMSFSKTIEQVRNKTKTVTRRFGWWNLKPGTRLWAVEKSQGLKKGEKVERICQIEIVSVRRSKLQDITEEDAIAEGIQIFEYGTEYDKDYGGREKNMAYSVGYGIQRLALSVMSSNARDGFRRLWDRINTENNYRWDSNPTVNRIEFKYVE